MEKKKALILVNPRSGRIVARQMAFSFGSNFRDSAYEPFIRLTTGPHDATDVVQRLAKQYDLVICRGGDGTLNETVNGVLLSGVDIPIGYIPAGTTNDFAKSNGIPFDAEEAIRLILEGEPTPQDVGLFGETRYFTYTASFGLFSKSSYSVDQRLKNRIGYAAYLASGAQELLHMRSIPLHVTVDGRKFEGEYIYGSVTNARSVGGGVMKFPEGSMQFDDGMMELVLIKKPHNPADFVKIFNGVQKGEYDPDFITVAQGEVFLFDFLGNAVPWSLDGEFGGDTTEVAIQCIKHGMRIIKRGATQA